MNNQVSNNFSPAQLTNFELLPKLNLVYGKLLSFFGKAVKVHDEQTNKTFYLKIDDVVANLFGNEMQFSKEGNALVKQRILEITDSDNRHPVSYHKLKELFLNFANDKAQSSTHIATEKEVLQEMDKLKLEMSDTPKLFFTNKISEIASSLQPGDIIIRKYHDMHDNYICDLQHFFSQDGYREAYKCSHITIYLGQIQEGNTPGQHWIAEASMPHGKEAQIRRIDLDDPRFLSREKNEYLVFRNKNKGNAAEAARMARLYCYKLLPEEDHKPVASDLKGGLKYDFIEAGRSMWHSHELSFYGQHRLFKHYADYKNGIPFEYLGQQRQFFCSHFAMLMESLAEMNNSEKFKELMDKNPIPKVYDQNKTGLDLQLSKIWYSVRKGVWARWMALKCGKEAKGAVPTHLDALRTAPQNVVNYMLDHKDQFELVGTVVRKSDFEETGKNSS